ncbi:MAG: DNA translocase FtsK [Chloroflexi bacterium]|nr:DNA translocase FtsK [Chloroflexota bacterium]
MAGSKSAKAPAKKTGARKAAPQPQRKMDPALQRFVLGLGFVLLALLSVLSLFSFNRSFVTDSFLILLRQAFGWGFLVVPLGLAALGLALILDSMDRRPDIGWEPPTGALLLFASGLGLLHLAYIATGSNAAETAAQGSGGGYIGFIVSNSLMSGLGVVGAWLVLLMALVTSLILLFGLSLNDIGATLARWLNRQKGEVPAGGEGPPPFVINAQSGNPPLGSNTRMAGSETRPPPEPAAPAPAENKARVIGDMPAPTASPAKTAAPPRANIFPVRMTTGPKEWRLPPIQEIFAEPGEIEFNTDEIRARVDIIERTLESFGVPARVVEVNQGPTITQFGVEPGYIERKDSKGRMRRVKVKVSRITGLSNDLALALAAPSIRIEAPVPGRPMMGIEVPNSHGHMVTLRSVMESDSFTHMTSHLKLALGQDVSGRPMVADLGTMPHLLIAGATGSGKSVCINSIIACLLAINTPDELKLMLVDPKRVELTGFNGIPHLIAPVIVDVERVVGALKWTTQEMDRRYKLFAQAGARNLEAYNSEKEKLGEEKLPFIVVVIDELADLMMVAPDEVEHLVTRIAQLARATGIHMIIATQRPSVDVITGLIKANFPARISFAVSSQVDSRVIMDHAGAERLLGRGDMLYMGSDFPGPIRVQGTYVSDAELSHLVNFWHSLAPAMPRPEPANSQPGEGVAQPTLTPDFFSTLDADDPTLSAAEKDDLWHEALEIIRGAERASVTLLQRRLRIGYSRAARLMDLMEKQGIVGPPEGANRSREVLIQDKDQSDEDAEEEEEE